MKKIREFVKKEIANEIILIPAESEADGFAGLIALSEVGSFIWDHLEEAESFEQLLNLIIDTYEVEPTIAANDTVEFLVQLLRGGIIRPDQQNW